MARKAQRPGGPSGVLSTPIRLPMMPHRPERTAMIPNNPATPIRQITDTNGPYP